jgi:hypothetical protein
MTNAAHDSTFTDRRRHQAAVRTKEGGTRKKLMVLLLAGCALVLSQGFRTVAAGDDNEIPLNKLAGTYAVTEHGSVFFCVQDTSPFPPAECGSPGSFGIPLTVLAVGSVTGAKGPSCAT